VRVALAVILVTAVSATILALSGCGEDESPEPSAAETRTVSILVAGEEIERTEPDVELPGRTPPKKLIVRNLIEGKGPRAAAGDRLTVEYVARNYRNQLFTNSWERETPFSFELGASEVTVNPGWEQGLRGIRVGGRRELILPPRYLYPGGAPPKTDPREALVYVIDLVQLDQSTE
jgi:peptidylprolyl isomerase